ncbi:hypothetical protein AX16_004262 [Volvariella volvacea WC 439]|nr:hypothetical protein AX16_004262 [Volvariella volvacea WC 439]
MADGASINQAHLSSQVVTLPNIPELFDPNHLDLLLPPPPTPSTPSDVEMTVVETPAPPKNPMLAALESTTNYTTTLKGAGALKSTLSAILDAWNDVGPKSFSNDIQRHLDSAWKEDPELTLRLIWSMRSIHNGKGERELFYRAYGWLYDNHPRTAIANLPHLINLVCDPPKRKPKKPEGDKAEQTEEKEFERPGLSHGYWKDLLNILALATVDELSEIEKPSEFLRHPRTPFEKGKKRKRTENAKTAAAPDAPAPEQRIQASLARDAEAKAAAQNARAAANLQRYTRLTQKLREKKYRALYITVVRLFAEQLAKDLATLEKINALESGEEKSNAYRELSLAGKWAPSPFGSHDKHTNTATAVILYLHHLGAPKVFPNTVSSLAPSVTEVSSKEVATTLRSFYQTQVLKKLRKALATPEPLMASNKWSDIRYIRVPSICMKTNTELFLKHDPKGFHKYLMDVESGKKTISGATLFPHELVAEAYKLQQEISRPKLRLPGKKSIDTSKFPELVEALAELTRTKLRVVESQWGTLIERLKESGSLDNCIAICDVSGSMGCFGGVFDKKNVPPIYPSVALSLVLASLAKEPWNGGFITFSESPEYVKLQWEVEDKSIEGGKKKKGLGEIVNEIAHARWGGTTDFEAVFVKLLLPLAVKNKIKQEDMIKRLFVFSDMQFDQSVHDRVGGYYSTYRMTAEEAEEKASSRWTTMYDRIEKEYKEAGYEVPEIVFWNLMNAGPGEAQGATKQVEKDRKGVAMMSGFSPALLKVFMG